MNANNEEDHRQQAAARAARAVTRAGTRAVAITADDDVDVAAVVDAAARVATFGRVEVVAADVDAAEGKDGNGGKDDGGNGGNGGNGGGDGDGNGGGGGGGGGGDGSNSCNNVSSDAAYLQPCRDYIASIESENRVLRQEVKSNDDEIKSIKLSLTGKENEIKQLQKEHTVALKDAEDAEEAANKVIKSNEDKKRTEIKQLQEKHTVALKDAQETLNAKELENAALTQEIKLTKEANTKAFNELEASHKVALDSAENRRVNELKLVEDSHEVEIDLLNVQIDKLDSHVNLFFQVANTVAKASDKKTKGKTKGKHRRSLSEDGKKRNSR